MSKKSEKLINGCRLFCQHCKAMQKVKGMKVDCLYEPLIHGQEHAFCASCLDAVKDILSLERTKTLEKYLKELTFATGTFLRSLDEAMKGPSTPERGQKIAKLSNALEMARDSARYFALGIDYRHDPEIKNGKRTVVK